MRETAGNTTTPSQAVYASARRSDFDHTLVSVSRTKADQRSKALPQYLRLMQQAQANSPKSSSPFAGMRGSGGASRSSLGSGGGSASSFGFGGEGRGSPGGSGGSSRKGSVAFVPPPSKVKTKDATVENLKGLLRKKMATGHIRALAMAVAVTKMTTTSRDVLQDMDGDAVLSVLFSAPFEQVSEHYCFHTVPAAPFQLTCSCVSHCR